MPQTSRRITEKETIVNNQRIQIWRSFADADDPAYWTVELAERTPRVGVLCGAHVEYIAHCDSHAEAIAAARIWIKANPLAIEPKAAA